MSINTPDGTSTYCQYDGTSIPGPKPLGEEVVGGGGGSFTWMESVMVGKEPTQSIIVLDSPKRLSAQPECYVTIQSNSVVPQFAYDMRAIVRFDNYSTLTPPDPGLGLHVHTAPGINTPKLKLGATMAGVFEPLWRNGEFVPWGATVLAAYKIVLGEMIWYQISGYIDSAGGVHDLPTDSSWIAVQSEQSVNYVAGSTCEPPDYSGLITFYYDRQASALMAIANSYYNNTLDTQALTSTNPSGGRASIRLTRTAVTPYLPFARFIYPQVTHSTGSSASAVFVSEGFWYGGYPMLLDEDGNDACPGSDVLGTAGWRSCGVGAGRAWGNHEGIVAFFTDGSTSQAQQGNNLLTPQGVRIEFDSDVDPNNSSTTLSYLPASLVIREFVSNISGGGAVITGATWDPSGLSTYVYNNAANLEAGDYMWINTGDNASPPNTAINHGLEIIGWGPIGTYTTSGGLTIDIRCEEAMSNLVFTVQGASGTFDGTLSTTPVIELYESRPSSNEVLVPYVVDFPGTTNGRTQRPIPRPFFCTRYSDPNGAVGSPFTPHSWYFYHFPSTVTVGAEQLYFPSQWTWTSGDN